MENKKKANQIHPAAINRINVENRNIAGNNNHRQNGISNVESN